MRRIGTIPGGGDAERFGDYLLTIGIAARIESDSGGSGGGGGHEVWIIDEDQVERARDELRAFLERPTDPRYDEAARGARAIRKQAADREKRFRRNFIEVGRRWRGPGGARPLTLALIASSVLVTLLTQFGHRIEPLMYRLLISTVEIAPHAPWWTGLREVRRGEVWRVVTPIFLHFGRLHLLFNMLWLYTLGAQVEARRGTLRYALLVLAIAATSNLAQYAVSRYPIFGGMSGVVYGLFGYVWMKSRFDPRSGFFMDRQIVTLMIVWLLLCMTGLLGPVANTAHGTGLALGAALGYAPAMGRRLRR